MSKELAKAVLKAVELREASYDHAEADKAQAQYHRSLKGYANVLPPDYNSFYRKSLREACQESCVDDPELAGAVYLLLVATWNDARGWAIETLKGK